MAYEKTVWVNGQAPALDAYHLNKMEQGIADAVSVTPQSLTDDQKSQARGNIGAAPDGFGLGDVVGMPIPPTVAGGLNTATKNGWYYFGGDGGVQNKPPLIPTSDYGYLLVSSRDENTKLQVFMPEINNYIAVRKLEAGVWQPWEYVNPPMFLGVEYRTTERYLGKPVYAKLVDCGTIPAQGTYKDLVFSPDASGIVSVSAYSLQRGSTLPFYDTNGVRYSIAGSGTTVMIWNYSESRLDTDVRALVKYTKTTD